MLDDADILKLRRVLLLTFLTLAVGIAIELHLLDHNEDNLQLIPIICIGACLFFAGLFFVRRSRFNRSLFGLILFFTSLSGLYGVFLHLKANYEFELEMTPSLSGWALFAESLSGALPVLAPSSMVILALVGYAYLTILK